MGHQFARKAKPAPNIKTASARVHMQGKRPSVPSRVRDVLRFSGRPLDTATRAFIGPRFRQDFGAARLRAPPVQGSEFVSERFGHGSEDPVHQPMLDRFRSQQGHPPGGIDEEGNQIGPTDAEIKYRTQPIAVLNGPFHAPIDDPDAAGMAIAITVQSSSGNNADMASVQDSEQVSSSVAHTGSFATMPATTPHTSTFMPAVNIPDDRHTGPRPVLLDRADNHGGSGSLAFQQLDIYNHARYGIFNPIAIPNSGYRITHSLMAGPGTRLMFRTEKSPEACTVNGYSTTAGPSPTQREDVLLRP